MTRMPTTAELVSRINLPSVSSHNALHQTVEIFRQDPFFCIPPKAREIVERLGNKARFVVLGTMDFGAHFIVGLKEKGTVLNVVDDYKSNRGEDFRGVAIISTDRFLQLAHEDPDIIAVNSCRYDFAKRMFDNICRQNGIACLNYEQSIRLMGLNDTVDYRVVDWGYGIASRFDEYTALEKRLVDSYSRETLNNVLMFHLTCNPEWYLNIARPYPTLYFRSGLFSFTDQEKFVDCGASIGESTSGLIGVTQGNIARSWMIEPDKFNVVTLKKLQRKYEGTELGSKLSLHPVAVGESSDLVPFQHMGGHGGIISPNPDAAFEKVALEPIDKIIDDVPTFIKMDIEGFELPALRGATKSIQAGKPKLAISAYHRATDLLDLPSFVDSIAPGYSIGLRHHTEDRWDTCLYFYDES